MVEKLGKTTLLLSTLLAFTLLLNCLTSDYIPHTFFICNLYFICCISVVPSIFGFIAVLSSIFGFISVFPSVFGFISFCTTFSLLFVSNMYNMPYGYQASQYGKMNGQWVLQGGYAPAFQNSMGYAPATVTLWSGQSLSFQNTTTEQAKIQAVAAFLVGFVQEWYKCQDWKEVAYEGTIPNVADNVSFTGRLIIKFMMSAKYLLLFSSQGQCMLNWTLLGVCGEAYVHNIKTGSPMVAMNPCLIRSPVEQNAQLWVAPNGYQMYHLGATEGTNVQEGLEWEAKKQAPANATTARTPDILLNFASNCVVFVAIPPTHKTVVDTKVKIGGNALICLLQPGLSTLVAAGIVFLKNTIYLSTQCLELSQLRAVILLQDINVSSTVYTALHRHQPSNTFTRERTPHHHQKRTPHHHTATTKLHCWLYILWEKPLLLLTHYSVKMSLSPSKSQLLVFSSERGFLNYPARKQAKLLHHFLKVLMDTWNGLAPSALLGHETASFLISLYNKGNRLPTNSKPSRNDNLAGPIYGGLVSNETSTNITITHPSTPTPPATYITLDPLTTDPTSAPPAKPFEFGLTNVPTTYDVPKSRKEKLLAKRTRARTNKENKMSEELEAQLKAKDAMIASLQAQAITSTTNTTTTATPAKQDNLTAASKHAPTSTPTPTPTTYASMAKKNPQAKKPTKAKAVLKAQAVRALQEPTGPSVYKFVYVPCCQYLKYGQVRKMLGSLKIQQSRIIDIHFPARGTVALLVHSSYKKELEEHLKKLKISPVKDFNPVTKAAKAQELFDQRVSNTCLRSPTHLGYSIACHFGSGNATPCLSATAFEKLLADLKAKTPVASRPTTLEEEAIQAFGSGSAMEEDEGDAQNIH
ncbi:hypothetical protein BDF14DRAFT_1999150 [Spinellus fusiger]|nr:hypothetical protein BDF14DRAFT_1999150 [Spinellus fusiger]